MLFSLLQSVSRRKPVPVIFIDGFRRLPDNAFRRLLMLPFYRLVLARSSRLVVYSSRQVQTFRALYRLPPGKVLHVPYHSTIDSPDLTASDGDYIFSGGDFTRDYASLLRVAASVSCPFVIAAMYRHYFQGLTIPPNVSIVTVNHSEFVRLMAGSRLVVLPFRRGLLHSGGQQTYINAMALGKPLVVADDCGADEYVRDGVTGILLAPGDSERLRDAVHRLLRDPDEARALGRAAQKAAEAFTPERFFERVFAIVEECCAGDSWRAPPGAAEGRQW